MLDMGMQGGIVVTDGNQSMMSQGFHSKDDMYEF